MDHSLRPCATLRQKLVHHPHTELPAIRRRPVEIPCAVKNHAAARPRTIVAAGEVIEYALAPAATVLSQLENHSTTVAATNSAATARDRSPVKIAAPVEGHPSIRIFSVRASGEAIQHALLKIPP